jgi:hypothetical protein
LLPLSLPLARGSARHRRRRPSIHDSIAVIGLLRWRRRRRRRVSSDILAAASVGRERLRSRPASHKPTSSLHDRTRLRGRGMAYDTTACGRRVRQTGPLARPGSGDTLHPPAPFCGRSTCQIARQDHIFSQTHMVDCIVQCARPIVLPLVPSAAPRASRRAMLSTTRRHDP